MKSNAKIAVMAAVFSLGVSLLFAPVLEPLYVGWLTGGRGASVLNPAAAFKIALKYRLSVALFFSAPIWAALLIRRCSISNAWLPAAAKLFLFGLALHVIIACATIFDLSRNLHGAEKLGVAVKPNMEALPMMGLFVVPACAILVTGAAIRLGERRR